MPEGASGGRTAGEVLKSTRPEAAPARGAQSRDGKLRPKIPVYARNCPFQEQQALTIDSGLSIGKDILHISDAIPLPWRACLCHGIFGVPTLVTRGLTAGTLWTLTQSTLTRAVFSQQATSRRACHRRGQHAMQVAAAGYLPIVRSAAASAACGGARRNKKRGARLLW